MLALEICFDETESTVERNTKLLSYFTAGKDLYQLCVNSSVISHFEHVVLYKIV